MKKFMVLLQLIPTSSQCLEEEDKLHMLGKDLTQKHTHWLKRTIKILEKVESMRKSTVSPQLIPTSSQCQEEEDKLHMLVKVQIQKHIHWLKLKRMLKILEKAESMRKSMVSPQLIPTFSQCQEEEDKLHMLDKDLTQKHTHWLKRTIKILEKVESMRKSTVSPQLIPTSSQCQEEEDKLHMLDKDLTQKHTHWLKRTIKILEKEVLMKKSMVSLQLILMFSQCQEEEDKLHMLVKVQIQKLIHCLKKWTLLIIKTLDLMFLLQLTI